MNKKEEGTFNFGEESIFVRVELWNGFWYMVLQSNVNHQSTKHMMGIIFFI
jgi:hypothetical protein